MRIYTRVSNKFMKFSIGRKRYVLTRKLDSCQKYNIINVEFKLLVFPSQQKWLLTNGTFFNDECESGAQLIFQVPGVLVTATGFDAERKSQNGLARDVYTRYLKTKYIFMAKRSFSKCHNKRGVRAVTGSRDRNPRCP